MRSRLPNTWAMSIESTLARVDAIRQALADPSLLVSGRAVAANGGVSAPSGGATETTAPSPGGFAAALARASVALPGVSATAPSGYRTALEGLAGVGGLGSVNATAAFGQGMGSRLVAIAESQIGQSEQPPGSNESPAIAQYRTATAGAVPGAPWCAYFASWAAREAGEPLGAQGQGLGSVGEIWSWAQSTGRAIPNGPGVVPQPGDLIVFGDEHVGIVKSVLPDGRIETIEGNYENKVAANVRGASEASGYVSMS